MIKKGRKNINTENATKSIEIKKNTTPRAKERSDTFLPPPPPLQFIKINPEKEKKLKKEKEKEKMKNTEKKIT
jgi:hypothetical protein